MKYLLYDPIMMLVILGHVILLALSLCVALLVEVSELKQTVGDTDVFVVIGTALGLWILFEIVYWVLHYGIIVN